MTKEKFLLIAVTALVSIVLFEGSAYLITRPRRPILHPRGVVLCAYEVDDSGRLVPKAEYDDTAGFPKDSDSLTKFFTFGQWKIGIQRMKHEVTWDKFKKEPKEGGLWYGDTAK